MKRSFRVLVLIALLATSLGGCREQRHAAPPASAAPATPPLVAAPYETCAEWTDWRAVCWRPQIADHKGQYAPPECRTIAAEGPRRSPGKALCLAAQFDHSGRDLGQIQTGDTLYCDRWQTGGQSCVAQADGPPHCAADGLPASLPFTCDRWSSKRPMNGIEPHAFRHPWCQRWENGLRVCEETPHRGLVCRDTTGPIETDGALPLVFECVRWDVPPSCRKWTDGANIWTREGCHGCGALGTPASNAAYFVHCLEQEGN